MTELQDSFEAHGISIENVFLFDYLLVKPFSACRTLNDVLELMEENEIRKVFGDALARRILAEDPDLAAYFQEAGGVFLDAECDYPDWRHVEFYPGSDKPKSWLTGRGRRIIRVYAQTLEKALKTLVFEAEKVENAEIERAIKARNKKEGLNAEM